MVCEEIRVDMRTPDYTGRDEMLRTAPLLHRLNSMAAFDPEYPVVLKEIFGGNPARVIKMLDESRFND